MTDLPNQQQTPLRLKLADATRKRPLTYRVHEFSSVDNFDAWIMRFSQGEGPDGKLLYQQCGGNCDPSFTFTIAPSNSGLTVNTAVHCGVTRDRRNGDMYNLPTTLRLSCGKSTGKSPG